MRSRLLSLSVAVLWSSAVWALPVTTHKGLVAAAHPLAARAGAEVLAQGGNAVDALVATAFALGVVEPYSSGLGGGGFALLYDAKTKTVKALDFREVAPAATSPQMFLRDGLYDPKLSRQGGLSVAVPGAVAGYATLAAQYGTKPLTLLVAPAIRLAESDLPYSEGHRRALHMAEFLKSFPEAAGYYSFERDVIGGRRRQPALARFLRRIGDEGTKAFYAGSAAEAMVRATKASGGVLTTDDLAHYAVRPVIPLEGSYRGHRVVSFPPPSAGGFTVLATLAALDREPAKDLPYGSVERDRMLVELFNRAYAARASMAGDPRQEPRVGKDVAALLTPDTATAWVKSIGPTATPPGEIQKQIEQLSIKEGPETSHLCVVDAAGDVALMTTTVNGAFGSGVFVPELGIVLNNEMDDFSPPEGGNLYGLVGGRFNAPKPGKTPVSTMAPTLVFDGDRPWIGVGAAGGSRIATAITQIILHIVDDGMDVQEAVAAPRLHAQYQPNEIRFETNGVDDETRKALIAKGYKVAFGPPLSNAQALVIQADGIRQGSGDPRGEGVAVAEDKIEEAATR